MFRYSASRFHGYERMDQVSFCNFFISHARKLVDGSNESDTPSSYPTDTGTLWVSALVFELGSYCRKQFGGTYKVLELKVGQPH